VAESQKALDRKGLHRSAWISAIGRLFPERKLTKFIDLQTQFI
jgi:hypothetical protein